MIMKFFCIYLALGLFLLSCNPDHTPIVDQGYIDSLVAHYSISPLVKSNELELNFWKNRMDTGGPGSSSVQGYAKTMLIRFYLFGDIHDLLTADSLIRKVSEKTEPVQPGIWLTLAEYNLLFKNYQKAKECIKPARLIGQLTVDQQKELLIIRFNIYFESGQYDSASQILRDLRANSDYYYYFNAAKMYALDGMLDSAISHLTKAAELARTNDYLKQLALSDAADLFTSHGDWDKAYQLFRSCILLNPADFHSILGLGWIALVKDRNDSLSARIFEFVRGRFKVPDPLIRLSQVEEMQKTATEPSKNAVSFVHQAEEKEYGNRYNLNLIEFYTDQLADPARAETIAIKELVNRTSPQSFAWYAWTLYKNNKKDLAFQIYETRVKGKPLKALELYWMGKLLAIRHDEEARPLFESAYKFRFDLDPSKQDDLNNLVK
jgi:hypothetical protein